jgi:hypothetical protein
MSETPFPWCRLYNEITDDPKLLAISCELSLSPLMVLGAWITLLAKANASPIRGSLYVTPNQRYSNATVTTLLHCSIDDANLLIESFLKYELIEMDESGGYRLKNFGKRNFTSDSSKKRVEKSRNKKKNVTVTPDERYSNGDVTLSETETETEVVVPRPNIYKIYESEIGGLTPMLSQELDNIEKEYPEGWFELAVKDAKKSTARVSLNYVLSILNRYKADGLPSNGKKPKRSSSIMDAV